MKGFGRTPAGKSEKICFLPGQRTGRAIQRALQKNAHHQNASLGRSHRGPPKKIRTQRRLSEAQPPLPSSTRPARSEAERAERGTSGTLVTEILGAPQRETGKEELVKSLLAPRPKTYPRRGNQPPKSLRHPAAPVSRLPKTRRHPLTPTPVQQLRTNVQSCGQTRFFSYTGRGAFSFGARPKGAPAAPRAVGRGGARERAQFSPQAETELSGLCDDDNGGRIPAGQAPLREQNPPRPPNGGPTVFRRVSASGPPGSSPPCGCGAVFPNSPRLLPGRQTNRPRPPPGGQGPCNGRFTSCHAAPSCASRGPEWPCASAGSWG